MFVTLRQYGYVRHIVCSAYKARFVTLQQYGYVRHIVCSTYKARFMSHRMFTTYKARFVTLRQYGYVRHIAREGISSPDYDDKIFASQYDDRIFASHCNDGATFITLRRQYIVCHILTMTGILRRGVYVHHITMTCHLSKKWQCDEQKCRMFIICRMDM
jgi:hypothetical protein